MSDTKVSVRPYVIGPASTSFVVPPPSTALVTLVNGLVSDGVMAKMIGFYVLAQPTEALAKINLVPAQTGLYDLTTAGSFTFTPNIGYTGNGSDTGLNTNFEINVATSTPSYDANSCFYGIYNQTSYSSVAILLGTTRTHNNHFITNLSALSAVLHPGGNGMNYDFTPDPQQSLIGLFCAGRNGANIDAYHGYGGGTPYTQSAVAAGSSDIDSLAYMCFMSANNATAPSFNANSCAPIQSSACFFGQALTATDINNIYSKLNIYFDAVGCPTP